MLGKHPGPVMPYYAATFATFLAAAFATGAATPISILRGLAFSATGTVTVSTPSVSYTHLRAHETDS